MAMADLWDATIESASLREVAEALAAHMLLEQNTQQARNELPPEARSALESLITSKGKMPAPAFERRFGAVRPMGPGKLERERPWLNPVNAAEVLWYRGFIFRAFDRGSANPNEMVFVPSDLAELLRPASLALSTQPAALPASPASLNPHPHPASPLTPLPSSLLDDVTTILIHIQNGNVRVRANGEWTNESRLTLVPMLRDADGVADNAASGRFALLAFLIAKLGWVRVQDGRARLNPQPVTNWLQAQPNRQRRVLFDAWLHANAEEWNDLAHVADIALEMTHAWANDPLRERTAVVDFWQRRKHEFGDWRLGTADAASLQSLAVKLKSAIPDFARPDGRYDTWHVRDVATGEFLNGFENWERVEGRLIRYLLVGPLRWLEADEGEEMGRLGDDETRPASPLPLISLSPSGQITVAAQHRFVRFQLARFADWNSAGDGAFDYRLTPRSLARASEQGIAAPRVVEFLEQHGGQLPSQVLQAINRWAERGAEARMERVRLLKTKDGATMEQLLTQPQIRRAMLERLAPNCIAVREGEATAVQAEIVKLGLLVD